MTEKRYYEKRYGDEFYIFDSNTISESDFEEKLEYQGYKAFEDSMMGDEVVNRLNELNDENEQLNENNLHLHHELRLKNDKVLELEKENKELKEQLKGCTKKAKEEIRKQAENDAIKWANIGR